MLDQPMFRKVEELTAKLEAKGLNDKSLEVAAIFTEINMASKYGTPNFNRKFREELYVERIAPYWLLLV